MKDIVAPYALLRHPVSLSTLDVPAPSLCTLSALSRFPCVPSHLSRSHFLPLPFPHLPALRNPVRLSLCLHSPFPHLQQLVTSSEVRIPPSPLGPHPRLQPFAMTSISQDEDLDAALYPIAVLLDELKNEDLELRLNATRRIKTIAEALGPERTRGELLPFLADSIDDEDEILLALATEFGDFIEEVGGSPHAYVLVEPLETLATVEETLVREKAVESLHALSATIADLSDTDSRTLHVDHMFPLLQRLASGDWFTSRVSACSLLPDIYRRIPADEVNARTEVLNLFKSLAEDETPMVRRTAAVEIGRVAQSLNNLDPTSIRNALVPVFADLVEDDQDSVRIVAVQNAATFAGVVMKQKTGDGANRVIELVLGFTTDKSWRVRYVAADELNALCDALGSEPTKKDLLPAFVKLLTDSEPEVRTAAANKVTAVAQRIIELLPSEIVPVVEEMVSDASQHVRSALASNIMGLAPNLATSEAVNTLVDVVMALLKDEVPEVRLNVISRLEKVSFIMSSEKLSRELLPAVVDLAEDKNWRVRLATMHHIPLLASQLGRDFFEENAKLGDLCISWLGDCVYSVREAAIANLKAVTEVFGIGWAKDHIVPQVLGMYDMSNNYLLRVTSLHAIGVLAEVVGSETVEELFLPIITERAYRDPVPNVRFCSAKTLNLVIPYVRQDVRESKIRPCLLSLVDVNEKDKDVNYFAQQALQKLGTCPS
ncbi:unnamed protein product [Chondrus crispus]|uniref:Phosphatase PP2A regulatory subunit A/Splicing factor 3B subunit 1-like HEAT repeat domain-containing protein n=1 Tax=Chondrus crispus TaxID=2769 RepID=R7Q7U9_CHOCR|nr:unnamed protein product [Chondrus crispus]CDF34104.1 unnamed protein product [Chondrus crispus]|eukprot:XP_005713923.1 unnamed protein product [Chondrus crispus]